MSMRKLFILGVCVSGALALAGSPAQADPAAGRAYVSKYCMKCHDLEPPKSGVRGAKSGPNFQAVADARTTSAIGLNVFLTSPHADMPNFVIASPDRADVVAFIMSLRGKYTMKPQ